MKFRSLWTWVTIITLILFFGTVWTLRKKSRLLDDAQSMLAAGALPSVTLEAANGTRRRLGDGISSASLLVVILTSPQCKYCERSYSAWKHLEEVATRRGHDVIMLATLRPAEQTEKLSAAGIRAEVFALTSRRDRALLRAYRTPQLAIIDASGRILGGHLGVLDDDTDVSKLVGVLESY